jgi:hypothetical protein
VCYYCGPPEDKDSEETGMDPADRVRVFIFSKKKSPKKKICLSTCLCLSGTCGEFLK